MKQFIMEVIESFERTPVSRWRIGIGAFVTGYILGVATVFEVFNL